QEDPIWGRYAVNVAMIKPTEDGRLRLSINVRRPPPLTGPQLEAHLKEVVAGFSAKAGASFELGGFYADEPLVFDSQAKVVKRLLAAYERATGRADTPAVTGGGTYAKRMPNAI